MPRKNILIVDDEAIIVVQIKRLLQSWGYRVAATASSGDEAIVKIEETRPDLILMDINIKGAMDGIDTSMLIREKFHIPVIYLTGHIDDEILKRVEKTNPYGYILKPFHDTELYAAIKVALHNSNAERDLELQYHMQSVLNTILRISLEPISIIGQLDRILDVIITVPWLRLESKGSIFTVEGNAEVLDLKVHRGFSEELLAACRKVPFGKCLCGKAAAARKVVFAECIDERHDITFEGMAPHGHFCVPITLADRLLGVINLYLKDRHRKTRQDEEFLVAVANTIAGIIARSSAEYEIGRLKQQNELILKCAGEGIYGLDVVGIISFVNPAASKMLGWKPEKLLGRRLHNVIHHDPHGSAACTPDTCHVARTFSTGKVYRVLDERFWRMDGSTFPVEYVVTPMFSDNDVPAGAVVVFMDISERKKAEAEQEKLLGELRRKNEELRLSQEKIIQSEKMAALGQLVSGVAHEINTPIGNSVMSASHLYEKTNQIVWMFNGNMLTKSSLEKYFQIASEDCDIIQKNLLRSSALIKSFKMVSGDQTSQQRRKFKLKDYIDDIVLSLKPMFRKTPHLITVNCEEGLELDSYPGAFAQIVTNLLMNALSHAFDEGSIGIVEINIFESASNIVMIIGDNGKGISEGLLCKIFDPFFTTKRKEGNSGLGLHIVYNIVNKTLKGDIYCESILGEGTSFIITFPKELK
jgi:PAS domain S-box-containing protein